jgi:hypothetical protein
MLTLPDCLGHGMHSINPGFERLLHLILAKEFVTQSAEPGFVVFEGDIFSRVAVFACLVAHLLLEAGRGDSTLVAHEDFVVVGVVEWMVLRCTERSEKN